MEMRIEIEDNSIIYYNNHEREYMKPFLDAVGEDRFIKEMKQAVAQQTHTVFFHKVRWGTVMRFIQIKKGLFEVIE